MRQDFAPPLQLKWTYPLVTTFQTTSTRTQVVATILDNGVVGLASDGSTCWHVTENISGRLIVQTSAAYTTGEGKLYRIDLSDGRTSSHEISGSLMYVDPDERTALVRHFSNDWNKSYSYSSLEYQSLDSPNSPIWHLEREGPMNSPSHFGTEFAIACGRLFLAQKPAQLVCIHIESGAVQWVVDLNSTKIVREGGPADLRIAPLVHGNAVIAPTPFGFGAFDVDTGELLWRHGIHAGPFNVYEDRLYMAAGVNFGKYRVLDVKTGELILERDTSELIARRYRFSDVMLSSGFAPTERHIFVGDNFGRLWALERDTGTPVWFDQPQMATPYVAVRQPRITGDQLYINSFSMDPARPQRLYCYGMQ